MVHHWRASDNLLPTPNPSEWRLYDGGHLIGFLQHGKRGGKSCWRGVIRKGELEQVIGYSPTLEQCAKDFWDWYILYGKGFV